MSFRLRGQEATLRVTVNGETQEGSFFKVKDLTISPKQDITEEDYLGEVTSDFDIQHSGFDISFSVDMLDRSTIDFLSTIVANEEAQLAHPEITLNVLYAFRAGVDAVAESYYGVILKIADTSFGGRKEYTTVSFEGMAKKRSVISL